MLSGTQSVACYTMQGTHVACEYYSMVNKLVGKMIIRQSFAGVGEGNSYYSLTKGKSGVH